MKLIIDIDEEDRTRVGNLHFIPEELKVKIAFAISNGIPLEQIRDEIGRCKTELEFQIAERDTKSKLLISHVCCNIVEIIDKYTK